MSAYVPKSLGQQWLWWSFETQIEHQCPLGGHWFWEKNQKLGKAVSPRMHLMREGIGEGTGELGSGSCKLSFWRTQKNVFFLPWGPPSSHLFHQLSLSHLHPFLPSNSCSLFSRLAARETSRLHLTFGNGTRQFCPIWYVRRCLWC